MPQNLFIAAYLVLQLGLPLRYYLRDEPFDERFAWRMFSPIRMIDCDVRFTEPSANGRAEVDPRTEVDHVWLGLMGRARVAVVSGYGAHHCEKLRARRKNPELYVDLRCMHPNGEVRRPVDPDQDLCAAVP